MPTPHAPFPGYVKRVHQAGVGGKAGRRTAGRVGRWLRRLALALLGAGLVLGGVLLFTTEHLATFGARAQGERLERMRRSPRYKDGVFVNREPTHLMMQGARGVEVTMAWVTGNEMRVPNCPLPLAEGTKARLAEPVTSGLRITWVGHSSMLIEVDGRRVLTDPVWSERASPSTVMGPRRFHPVPLALADLPPLDAVLISHDHYDHLDWATVQHFKALDVPFFVALGVGAHLEAWGIPPSRIVELDWWEERTLGGERPLRLVSTPARHFSGRGPFDRNTTLWTSWSILGAEHRVFFSGDTGPTPQHAEVGEKLGPFDVAMLEVGAYHPNWGDIHLGPRGALEAAGRLRARRLWPVHWGTFQLALHAWSEPAETLWQLAREQGQPLVTPLLGEPVEPLLRDAYQPWWQSLPPLAARCPGS